MAAQPTEFTKRATNKRVERYLHNADVDLMRFAHVIGGWARLEQDASVFYESLAESLSSIVMSGDMFCRSLTHVHAPNPHRVEVRCAYRASWGRIPIAEIAPYLLFTVDSGGDVSCPRVDFTMASKALQTQLKSHYGDLAKLTLPAFEIIHHLLRKGWWVTTTAEAADGYAVIVTNGHTTIQMSLNYIPMRQDKEVIQVYLTNRRSNVK